MSEMEKVKIELFEKPINYNYSGFKGEKLAFNNFFIPLINYGIDVLKNGTSRVFNGFDQSTDVRKDLD